MIAIVIVVSILVILYFYDSPDSKSWFDQWKSPSRRRSRPGQQDQPQSHGGEKGSVLGKVGDKLNLAKHFGFISDVDSPANQAAIAAAVAEGQGGEDKERPPVAQRVKQGLTELANVSTEAASNASGGVAPRAPEPREESKSEEEAPSGGSSGHAEVSGAVSKESGLSSNGSPLKESAPGVSTQKEPEQRHKHSWIHKPGHKEHDPQAGEKEKDEHAFANWAVRTARKLGDVVASKDLTDDPSSRTKTSKN